MDLVSDLKTQGDDNKKRNAAFDEIYKRYGGDIRRYCRSRLNNTSYVDDAVQDTFIVLIRSPEKIPVDGERFNLKTYLLKCAQNMCRNLQRHANSGFRDNHEQLFPENATLNPEREPEEKDPRIDILREELDDLSDKLRRPLELHLIDKKEIKTCAEMLGISEKEFRTRLRLGKSRLKTSMNQGRKSV